MPRTNTRIAAEAYLLLSALVIGAGALVVRSAAFAREPEILAWAVSVDIALLLPALYLLFARRTGWPAFSVVPVLLLALGAARMVLPAGRQGVVSAAELMMIPLELAIFAYAIHMARRIRREYRAGRAGSEEILEPLEEALARVLGSRRAARIFATEAAVLYYSLFAWRRRPPGEGPPRAFTYHVACGYGAVVGVFTFLILVETSLVHVLLWLWKPWVAWVVSAVSLYSILFLIADFNAARRRPILVDGDTLHLRVGLRWRARIPLAEIDQVEAAGQEEDLGRGALKAMLIGQPNVIVRLRGEIEAIGWYGRTRRFDRAALGVDDPEGLREALRAAV